MIWYCFRCRKSVKCQQNLAENCSSVLKLVSLEVVSLEALVYDKKMSLYFYLRFRTFIRDLRVRLFGHQPLNLSL